MFSVCVCVCTLRIRHVDLTVKCAHVRVKKSDEPSSYRAWSVPKPAPTYGFSCFKLDAFRLALTRQLYSGPVSRCFCSPHALYKWSSLQRLACDIYLSALYTALCTHKRKCFIVRVCVFVCVRICLFVKLSDIHARTFWPGWA